MIEEPKKKGVSAVMVQDYSAKRTKDYEFSWKRCLSFEGDTGPFLQYSHARLNSILAKYTNTLEADSRYSLPPTSLEHLPLDHFEGSQAYGLLQEYARYPDLVQFLTRQWEPCNLLTYLFTICHKIASAVEHLWVMNQPPHIAYPNAVIYWCAKQILRHGFGLLGLTPLERM